MPYPVDYGGVFDLFYKLPALQKQGVKIYLHCFQYGRPKQPVLNQYCEEVYYYERHTGLEGMSLNYPYIVNSRNNEVLAERLLKDHFPVFMEGIHSTFLLNDDRFKSRQFFVRLHNVEHIYYWNLYKNVTSPFKKIYFYYESKLLARYEKNIVKKATFWSVTEKDAEAFRALGCKNIELLPLFLPEWKVNISEGKGSFCLYQGDLSTGENEYAVIWLIKNIFNDLDIPFVIAGKNPTQKLYNLVYKNSSTCLIADPNETEMQDLIAKAHINIIPSFNSTGIKVKLINALFNGRHCIVNKATAEGSGFESICRIANDVQQFKNYITELYEKPFNNNEIDARRNLLTDVFDNEKNARQMVKWIFG